MRNALTGDMVRRLVQDLGASEERCSAAITDVTTSYRGSPGDFLDQLRLGNAMSFSIEAYIQRHPGCIPGPSLSAIAVIMSSGEIPLSAPYS